MIWAHWFLRIFCPVMFFRAAADLYDGGDSAFVTATCIVAMIVHTVVGGYFWLCVPLRWRA